MSHAKREVGAAYALLLFQRRIRDNRLSAAPWRACPRRSTSTITRLPGRYWLRSRNKKSDGLHPRFSPKPSRRLPSSRFVSQPANPTSCAILFIAANMISFVLLGKRIVKQTSNWASSPT